MDAYPIRGSLPGLQAHVVTMEGTGAAAPTKLYGQGVTITRTSEGLYKLTWSNNPGTFVALFATLGAATPVNVTGHQVTHDTWDSATNSIEILFSEADFTIDDLEDNEFINVVALFKVTGA